MTQPTNLAAPSAAVLQAKLATSPAAGVIASLRRSQTAVLQLLSDSTGVGSTSWFGRLGALIGQRFPQYNVLHRQWNATSQWYDLPTVLRAGPNGDNKVTFAGSAALRWSGTAITGDLDVRAKILPGSWNTGAAQTIASRWVATGNLRSWWFGLATTGTPVLTWTTDGTTGTQVQVFASTGLTTLLASLVAGQPAWLRVTLDVDNGASGNDAKFYTSLDGDTWTQLGTTRTTAGASSVFAGTAQYQLGALDTSVGSTMAGDFYWVEIRDGIDGPSQVPPLPTLWDYATGYSTDTVIRGGSPTLLLVSGSEVSQTIAYWDNSTRRPRALSPHRQDLVLMSSSHNEDFTYLPNYVTSWHTWAGNVKTLLPYAPQVAVTQNPQQAPRTINQRQAHAARGAQLISWARANAVTAVDAYQAFTNPAAQINATDGVHHTGAGAQAQARYVYAQLFGGM